MKIALCISGETREFNIYYPPNNYITWLREKGHTVDVFAHTWSHCEKPQPTIFNFKQLIIEDQDKVIGDWSNVDPEFRSFSFWDEENNCRGVPQPLEVTKEKIGQHVSGWKCLQLPETDDYDFVIRWRWDLAIATREHVPEIMDILYPPQLDYISTYNEKPLCMTDCVSRWGRFNLELNDIMYLINKPAHINIKNSPWEQAVLDAWAEEENPCSYHTLWNLMLGVSAKAEISTMLPDVHAIINQKRLDNK